MRTPLLAAALTAVFVGNAQAAGLPLPGAANPQTLKMPSGPGSVRGLATDPSVSTFTGQMSYEVPIDLPAAAGGFKPALGLVYNGGLGNGSLGVGWSLGFPSIARSTRLGVPRYDATDELELGGVAGGGRMVKLSDGSYRILGEGQFIKVVASADGKGFLATDGDGRVYSFGTAAASRIESAGKTAVWLPDSIVDLAGQKILFTYEKLDNELYLKTLVWGPDSAFRVDFTYGERPDPVISYRTGFRVRTAQRLKTITLLAKAPDASGVYKLTTRRSYVLAYDNTLPLSRLAQVTMFGSDGVTAAPPTVLTYAKAESPTAFQMAGTGGWVLGQAGVSLLDVDGDGVADLLKMADGVHAWRRNRGGNFASQRSLSNGQTSDLYSARIMDLDGDARPELVRIVSNQWTGQRLIGETWGAAFAWTGTANLPLHDPSQKTSWVDIDGDSRTDVVQPSGEGLAFYRNGAGGYAPAVLTGAISSTTPGLAPGQEGVRFFDANGDGLDDVLWLAPAGIRIYLGRGNATFEEQPQVAYPWSGAVDLANLHLADMNRDGIVDLVRVVAGNVELYHGRGGGFDTVARKLAQPVSNVLTVTVADANGNGSQDLIWCSSTQMFALDLAGATEAGMLTSIDNGLGKIIDVGYEASGVLAMNAEIAGNPWVNKLPASIPVVVSTVMSPGAGEPQRRTEYMVREAFWDATERRFGGYLQGQTILDPGGPYQRIENVKYHAGLGSSRVLRGKPLTSSITVGNQVIESVEHKWETGTITGLTAAVSTQEPLLRFAKHVRETKLHSEGLVTAVQTLVERDYDDQGRLKEERNFGRGDWTGDEIVTRLTYASNDAQWVRDRVVTQTILDGSGKMISERQFLYGDNLSIGAPGVIGRGWVRVEKQHLVYAAPGQPSPTDEWVVTSTASYDALGNITGGLKDGVLHKVEYDPRGLYALREITTPAPGKSLVWSQTFDETLGQVKTVTEPNGVTVTVGYDALGRPVSMARGGQLPHVFYEYDWSAPRPQTVTWEFLGADDAVTAKPATWSAGSKWRRRLAATNGAGDEVLAATQLGPQRWIVDSMRVRNARGLTVERAMPFYHDGASPPMALPAGTPRETVVYDAHGRPTEQILPDGAHRRTVYTSVSQATTVDGQATVTSFFDAQRRIIRTQRTVDGKNESVDATYDPTGHVLTMKIADGLVTHSFAYDTLGRMRRAVDPDLGQRTYEFDAANRLIKAQNAVQQWVSLAYDGIGRMVQATTSEGAVFAYHYDEGHPLLPAQRVLGRLGWVEEPGGYSAFSYALGGQRSAVRRSVLGQTMVEQSTFAASGDLLALAYDDGLTVDYTYDPAGRLVGIGDYWQATDLDAAGRVKGEVFGNGATASYEHDASGQVMGIQVTSGGQVRLDLGLTRTPFGAIATVVDSDGVGLSHSAEFDYDGGGRLTWAEIGSGADAYQFAYVYDRLDNMIQRHAGGPASLGILAGNYVYGGDGAGPRQLSSIEGPSATVATFSYDAAGRQLAGAGATLVFDALDQLVSVKGKGAGEVKYGYGHDALRTYATGPAGTRIWFSHAVTQDGGVRDHYLLAGDRTVAKVSVQLGAPPAPAGGAGQAALLAATLGLLAYLIVRGLRHAPRRGLRVGAALVAGVQLASCGGEAVSLGAAASTLSANQVHYFHTGVAAGPALITRADGSVAEERRFEPFGQPIDAWRQDGGVGPVDFTFDPMNSLGKPSDPTTGWSYHGARWMAPETGRWFSPDPLVKAPDADFMKSPWRLNPYTYGDQNPVRFWDPDGKEPKDSEPKKFEARAVGEDGQIGYKASFDQGKVELGPGMTEQRAKANVEVGYLRNADGQLEWRFKIEGVGEAVTTEPWSEGAFGPVGFEWSIGQVQTEIALGGGRDTVNVGGSAISATLVVGKQSPNGGHDLTMRVGAALGPNDGQGVTIYNGDSDADGDGVPEHGIGIGGHGLPVDLEIKTELISQAKAAYNEAERMVTGAVRALEIVNSLLGD